MHKYTITLLLLCIGYFIDFYDLTIFAVGYVDVIKDLFGIVDINSVQKLFLIFTNFQIAGIVAGGLFFGILGDKIGRTQAIKYSILFYSFAIIMSCYVKSITIFAILRFLIGFGLATEYATSSVLIGEIFAVNSSVLAIGILYLSGICGGIVATFLNNISWRFMFLFGGGAGIALYTIRSYLKESPLFIKEKAKPDNIFNSYSIINTFSKCKKIIKLVLLIIPYYFVISIMFIMPKFMTIKMDLSNSIYNLLIGFFIGNVISTIYSVFWARFLKDFRPFLFFNSFLFILLILIAYKVNQQFFLLYAICLGCLGGGLPTIWIQIVSKSYGTVQRNTATNLIYILGRLSMIFFNIGLSLLINLPKQFWVFIIFTAVIIFLLNFIIIRNEANLYNQGMDYIV
jgi:MFS family permease